MSDKDSNIGLLILSVNELPQDYMEHISQYRIAEKRLEKMNRYRYEEDKKRCLCGGILFSEMCDRMGIAPKDRELATGPHGKPYLRNVKNRYFNLSHAGEYVVCAYGDCDLGIDVEQSSRIQLSDRALNKICTEEENEYICLSGTDESERRRRICRIWTMKEAMMKMWGTGFAMSPKSFCVPFDGRETKDFWMWEKDLGDYHISLCVKGEKRRNIEEGKVRENL